MRLAGEPVTHKEQAEAKKAKVKAKKARARAERLENTSGASAGA